MAIQVTTVLFSPQKLAPFDIRFDYSIPAFYAANSDVALAKTPHEVSTCSSPYPT